MAKKKLTESMSKLIFIGLIVLDITLIWGTIQFASKISLAILVNLGGFFIFGTIVFGLMALILSIFLIGMFVNERQNTQTKGA